MMSSGDLAAIQTPIEVRKEVEDLASEIKTFETYATSAGFIGAALGSVLAIPFGPIAFVSGAAVAAFAVGSLKAYAQARKKSIEQQLQSLVTQQMITDEVAGEIRDRLGLIHTDNPDTGEFSPSSSTTPANIQRQ
jgi:hypothetical protein